MLRDGQLCGGDGMNVPAYPASPHAVRRIVAVQHGEKPVLHPAGWSTRVCLKIAFHKEYISGNQFHDIPFRVKDTAAVMCRGG